MSNTEKKLIEAQLINNIIDKLNYRDSFSDDIDRKIQLNNTKIELLEIYKEIINKPNEEIN